MSAFISLLHTVTAAVAVPLGAFVLFGKKGSILHKKLGRYYFISMLLKEKRAVNAPINWSLVDLLTPFGGIRIEDNVRLLPAGAGVENLTRDAFSRI